MKLTRLFLMVIVSVFLTVPVYAHGDEQAEQARQEEPAPEQSGLVKHAVSLHEKIDEFLTAAASQNYYTASLESRTATDVLLDVRDAASYQKTSLPGSVNIPLAELHSQLKTWDKTKKVYVVGDTDVQAAYAVFLLRIHGVDAWAAQTAPKACPHHAHASH